MKKALSLIMALVMIASCFMTASAAAIEVIAGNDFTNATQVEFDTEYVSSLVVENENDWYKVTTLDEPATYTFSATSDQISINGDIDYGLNLVVYEVDATGTVKQIAVICNNGKVTPDLSMNKTYYIKIYAGAKAEDKYGQYKFNIECITHEETVELESISVTKMPDKTTFLIGENLDTTGMKVTALYNDGSTKDVTSSVYVSNFDSTTTGKKTLNVYYREGDIIKDCSFDVNVVYEVVLKEIQVTTMPAKTIYAVGDKFDHTGMAITAIYSDGTSKVLKGGFGYYKPDMESAGIKNITVFYKDTDITCEDIIQIEVIEKAPADTLVSISASTLPSKTTYYVGETFSYAGLVVAAKYADGSTKAVTGYTVSAVSTATSGEKTVTVTYSENGITKTCTFKVTVVEAPVAVTLVSIDVISAPTKTTYKVGETANYSGISVQATFSDGTTILVPYSACLFSGFSTSSVGTKIVTVSYSYNSVTKYDTFSINVESLYAVCLGGKIDVSASTNSIRYKDILILNAKTTAVPNSKIAWEFIGQGFTAKTSSDGEVAYLTCTGSGTVIVKVTALDYNGNPVVDENGDSITDTFTVSLDGGFIAKIISFFKDIFGIVREMLG